MKTLKLQHKKIIRKKNRIKKSKKKTTDKKISGKIETKVKLEGRQKISSDEEFLETLSVKREVKKELTRIKKLQKSLVKCIICNDNIAKYQIKGSNNTYCTNCAKELFDSLDLLQRI